MVIPDPGADSSVEAIARHVGEVLPRFAQPCFIGIVEALPKTPTNKVQTAKLRERGVTAQTWDRAAAETNCPASPG